MNYRRAIDAVQGRLWPRTAAQEGNANAPLDLRAVLIGLMIPTAMLVLNQNMFGVAVPAIRDAFVLEADTVAWLVTAYTLPFVMFMPLYGRMGDGLGKRGLFSIGIILFSLGTVLCLIADSLTLFFVGRVLQGAGTAGVNPLCIAIIADLFPDHERGRALAAWSSTGPATGIVAPFLGGMVVDFFGWQSMFAVGLVAALAAMWGVRAYVPRLLPNVEPRFFRNFDWGGMTLLSGAILFLVAYLSSRSLTGVESLQDWRLALGTLVFGFAFWRWERRHPAPLIPFDLFRVPNFSRASLAAGLRMILMSSEGFLIPLYLTDIYGVSGTQIGLMITLQAAALLTAVRFAGKLADAKSRRWPVVIGFSAQAAVMVYFANLPPSMPLWAVAVGATVHGGAAGMSLAVLHRLSMDNVPAHRSGAAAGLYSMMRFFGSIIGATIGGVILAKALDYFAQPVQAYHLTFAIWAAVAVLAVITIWPVRDVERA
jgi:EmrB/QacA subfamily drug resistance transporter